MSRDCTECASNMIDTVGNAGTNYRAQEVHSLYRTVAKRVVNTRLRYVVNTATMLHRNVTLVLHYKSVSLMQTE